MNDWIDIIEQGFPPVNEEVLVYDHDSIYIAIYTGNEVERKDGYKVPVWDDGEGAMGFLSPALYPTHWMPLPNPPTENTDGMVVIKESED